MVSPVSTPFHFVEPQIAAQILGMIKDGTITRPCARDLFEIYFCVGMVRSGRASGVELNDGTIWHPPSQSPQTLDQ